ncbi:hypothetical protein LDL08_38845 [Nonomuraea glycinis]|uniref:hypothetical protein n=1 Tax=Nonomuraea glycinis TaxID=2047744 RepID=UPI00166C3140|nr:hypothetical protein [Nonomuraea glycinis]MCA2182135.1 hypothetical protein [Nonomuraea glycinis]
MNMVVAMAALGEHKVPESLRGQAVKQPSEEDPISRRERGLGHLPLQHHQLVP